MTSTRVDRKYLLPEDLLRHALVVFGDSCSPERVDGLERQRYETEYFDTPDLQLFHAARGRRALRSKVRVRHYIDTRARFVEVKSRNARGETTKVRDHWNGSFADARAFLQGALSSSSWLVDQLVPIARTSYEREAYVLVGSGRMTVDRCLMVGRHDALSHRLLGDSSELVVVETKAPDQGPTAIDRYLWDCRYRPISLSKYALAIASFRPDLPLNRWTEVASRLQSLG
jgi:VTC domain